MNLLLFYLPTFFLICASSQLGQISVPTDDSYITYEPFSWQVGSGPLDLALDFETKSQDGAMFGLIAQNETGDFVYQLKVFVSERRLVISQAEGLTFGIPDVVSDGEIHRLILSYEFDRMKDGIKFAYQLLPNRGFSISFGTVLNFAKPGDLVKISMFFGKSDRAKSVVGCLQPNITTGGSNVLLKKASSGNGASEKCPTPCSTGELKCLNGGVCKDFLLTNSVCDCYGSGHSGPTCEKDLINVVGLKDKTDFYYSLDESENVQRIALSFKLDLHNPETQRIFNTDLWKGRPMHLYYEADKRSHIFLSIDKKINKEFQQFIEDDGKWHNFVLTIDYSNRVMSAKLDSEELKIPFGDTWRSKGLFDEEINFGGIGFAGCLTNIYVNNNQVLEMLNNSDSKVGSRKSLTFAACPDKSAKSTVSFMIFVLVYLVLLW